MKLSLLPLFLSFACLASAQTRAGRDYAVFFYVTDFQPGISDIPYTKAEAEELAAELGTHYGFTCAFVRECKKSEITAALADWNKKLTPDDQALFFFSMHGYYDADSDRGYLIPADGRSGDQHNYFTSWLSYDDLRTRYSKEGLILIEDMAYHLHKLKNPEPEDGSFIGYKAGGEFVFLRKDACATAPPIDTDGGNVPDASDHCPGT